MIDLYSAPSWACDEVEVRMLRAKTPAARSRLQAVIDEVWSVYEGGPGPSEEEVAADCDARQWADQ